jgi:signal transduction histidine kinase
MGAVHPPRTPPEATAFPAPADSRAAAILDLLPVPVAVRGPDGYLYRNGAHRGLAAETLNGDEGDGGGDGSDLEALGITQVTDPASGRVYLCTRSPLGEGPDGVPEVLEILEDITGRHSDRDEIARQRDALARDAEALARANRELKVIDRAKAAFIARAAHEVRTPLTALGNALALLRRAPESGGAAGGGDGGGRFLAMAERNVGRLAVLADDLLAFTKLEVGHLGLNVAPVDLGALVAEAASGMDPEEGPGRVRVTGGGRLPAVHSDPDHLGQVVRALVAQALEHAPEGHAVRVALAHRRRWPRPADPGDPTDAPLCPAAPDGWLEVAVSDPAGAAEADPGAPLADGDEALGLGLAVGRRIAALHGGALWARTGPGGRTVLLRLPVLAAADARLLPVQEAWRRLPRHGSAATVVVLRAEGDADPGSLCAALGKDPDFAAVPETGEVVGAVAPEAVTRIRRAAARWSRGHGRPIRMGWSSADAADFTAALARARAAARPVGWARDEGGRG